MNINSLTTNIPSAVHFKELVQAQHNDSELAELMESQSQHSLVLQQKPLSFSNETVVCDIATGKPCLFVPHTLRRAVFTALHSLAH